MSESNELYLNFDEYIRQGEPQKKEPVSTPTSTPISSTQDLLQTENPLIRNLVRVIGNNQCNIKEMLEGVGLKDRKNFLEYHLSPAISEGYVRMQYPDKPRHPRQKYLLTVKGLALYNELTNEG